MASLTVEINSTVRSALAEGTSIVLEQAQGSATLLIPDLTIGLSISVLQTAVVKAGGTAIFSGYILRKRYVQGKYRPGQRLIALDCVSKSWRLAHPRALITASYTSESDQNIALDLLAKALLDTANSGPFTASTSTVDSTKTGITSAFGPRATAQEALDQLKAMTSADYFIDASDTFHWNADAGAASAPWNVNVDAPNGSTTFDVLRLEYVENVDQLANDIEVVGGEGQGTVKASASDATSQSTYGIFFRRYEDPGWVNQSTVDEIAAAALASYKDPSFEFQFDTRQDGLLPNQAITLTCADYGLSAKSGIIKRVEIKQQAASVTLYRVKGGNHPLQIEKLLRRLKTKGQSAGQASRVQRGFDFTAASSERVATASSVPNLEDMADISIMIRFSIDSSPSTDFGLVAKFDAAANTGWQLNINPGFSTVEFTRSKTITNYSRTRTCSVAVGEMHTLVCVASSAAQAKFWLDGVALTTGGGGSIGSGSNDSDVGDPLEVARYDGTNYFDGFLADAVVWDIALPDTYAEKAHLADCANKGNLPFADDIQLLWRMDEAETGAGYSGVVYDRSGNGYNGTPANTPTGAERTLVFE